MIPVSNFVTGTLATVDKVIGNFVITAYHNFVHANAGVITSLFTIYIMILAYQFMTHQNNLSLSYMMKHLITMLIVYSLVMNWHLYHLFVYNIFTNEPNKIAEVLVKSSHVVGNGPTEALDKIYQAVIKATIGFFGQVNFSVGGLVFIFYGILVFLIGTMMCVFALLLFIYAKMMMAISLALGPIFILFILWDATKGLFSSWVNKLITIALIPIVTSAILVLMLSIVSVTLPNINQPTDNIQFYGLAPFLSLNLATTLILSQVFRICSSLGGGITLSSLSRGGDILKSAMNYTGLNLASSKFGNLSANTQKSKDNAR